MKRLGITSLILSAVGLGVWGVLSKREAAKLLKTAIKANGEAIRHETAASQTLLAAQAVYQEQTS